MQLIAQLLPTILSMGNFNEHNPILGLNRTYLQGRELEKFLLNSDYYFK